MYRFTVSATNELVDILQHCVIRNYYYDLLFIVMSVIRLGT